MNIGKLLKKAAAYVLPVAIKALVKVITKKPTQ